MQNNINKNTKTNKCELCSMDATHNITDINNVTHYFCERHSLKDLTLENKSKVKSLKPLLYVFLGITLLSLIRQYFLGINLMLWMMDFMGVFLVTFGLFKLYDLEGFVKGFSSYDIIAKRYKNYGYIFPFLEIILGGIYMLGFMFLWQNILVLIISILGSLSAYNIIIKKEEVHCVCLGTAFNLPMTWVTFLENFLMLTMVTFMILM